MLQTFVSSLFVSEWRHSSFFKPCNIVQVVPFIGCDRYLGEFSICPSFPSSCFRKSHQIWAVLLQLGLVYFLTSDSDCFFSAFSRTFPSRLQYTGALKWTSCPCRDGYSLYERIISVARRTHPLRMSGSLPGNVHESRHWIIGWETLRRLISFNDIKLIMRETT